MKRQLIISPVPLDESALWTGRAASSSSGAVVYFLGVVRGQEQGQSIAGLEYEAFQRMAEHQFHKILDELEARWPVESVRVIHRVGMVGVGQTSLWVEVVAPHREEAFAAGQFLIDAMKQKVPIWKKPIPLA